MQNKLFWLLAAAALFSFCSCLKAEPFEAEITDINGTWQPHWSWAYKPEPNEPVIETRYGKELFSWGVGKKIVHLTFHVDITAEKPFIEVPDLGYFPVDRIEKTGKSSITVSGFRGRPDAPEDRENGWNIEVTFHMIDKDTLWIESKELGKGQSEYGKKSPWHRLSGPGSQ
jgi:hypothetical protein